MPAGLPQEKTYPQTYPQVVGNSTLAYIYIEAKKKLDKWVLWWYNEFTNQEKKNCLTWQQIYAMM